MFAGCNHILRIASFCPHQARFWVQVMRDLRDGVKLKKVQERQYNPLPIEYQLTPYEMLMDDIRSKRYKLRKVMVKSPYRASIGTYYCSGQLKITLYRTPQKDKIHWNDQINKTNPSNTIEAARFPCLWWLLTMSLQVNGDIPPRLKKSAHEIILEFIRSRPPLNPVSSTHTCCSSVSMVMTV